MRKYLRIYFEHRIIGKGIYTNRVEEAVRCKGDGFDYEMYYCQNPETEPFSIQGNFNSKVRKVLWMSVKSCRDVEED